MCDGGHKKSKSSCLVSGCPNCKFSPDAPCIDPSSLDASLWITFHWDLLLSLRRYSLAELLDTLAAKDNFLQTGLPSLSFSNLVELEHDFMEDKFGSALLSLIKRFTVSSANFYRSSTAELIEAGDIVAQSGSAFRKSVVRLWMLLMRLCNASYTLSLARWHLNSNGHTHRLRGLIPRNLVRDELLHLDHSVLFATVTKSYIKGGNRLYRSTAAGARLQSTDPGMSLLGAMQLLLLILSLLAPLHLRPAPTPIGARSVHCPTIGDEQIDSLWSFDNGASTDCTQVPTLGWFDMNSSLSEQPYSNSSTVSSSCGSSSAVMSPFDLLRNLSAVDDSNECWFDTLSRWIEYFTCELTRLLLWLENGEPAGLKINLHLARLLGHFFLYHIIAWRAYASWMIRLAAFAIGLLQQLTEVHSVDELFCANLCTSACLMLGTVYLLASSAGHSSSVPTAIAFLLTYVSTVIRLTLALLGCLLLDLINLTVIHLTTFYIYIVNLLSLQLRAIGAAWRLCRNTSKWNPLRGRVDTVPDMCFQTSRLVTTKSSCLGRSMRQLQLCQTRDPDWHLDRLFVATLLGLAVGLCLLPTTLAFYVTFTMVRLSIVFVHQLLRKSIAFVLDVPTSALMAWAVNSKHSRTELAIIAPNFMSSKFPVFKLTLVRPSFQEAYRINRLLRSQNIFGPGLTFGALLRHVLTAKEI
ncbi:Phosphatidylinositol N-acetylglucosaminyltransferase subunit Q [Paragonimus heterotremus]|uniref:Phosphatidylinositol N-acetylglucosaminyltransferase subunit Q n=1 Tax=Paragonimus heterotremus TaxID=100268 RepID=A0A8J4T3J3_9TREM|nr:Phosphatidylinositol N-acetylglucosaminyltransferase subunit Q [Paragonimus heterotremus]